MTSTKGERWVVPAALAVVYLVWGSTYLAIRVALETLPPFLMAGARFLLAGGVLLVVARAFGAALPTKRQWKDSAKVGALLLLGGNGGVVFAQQHVASGLAAVVIASVSLWSVLFGGWFGVWPSARQWVGVAVGLSGVLALNLDAGLSGKLWATAVLVCSAGSWAFGSVWSRRLDLPAGSMASAAQMLCGGVFLAGLGALRGESFPVAPSWASVGAFFYLVVFGSLLGFSAYRVLLEKTTPAVATSYAYVNPVVAVVLGALLVQERPGPWVALSLAVILAGVALVTRSARRASA